MNSSPSSFPVQILSDYGIPESFLDFSGEERCCIFMISCHSDEKYHEMGFSTKALMGYTPAQFQEGGMQFWFSLIHPEDRPLVSEKIIAGHGNLTGFRNGREASPMHLDYRIKHADGAYFRIRDTRFLLTRSGENIIDNILCRMEPVCEPLADDTGIDDLLQKERSCNHMLEAAVLHQASQNKEPLQGNTTEIDIPAMAPRLTAREKEILRLIADGLSSKMIADRCFISVNTVETHRRHLLEKLGVKNSMELVKQASKVWVL